MSGGFTVASAKPSFLLVNRHMRLCLVTAGNCASRSATQSEIVHAIGALRLRLVWNIETQNRRHKNERAAQTVWRRSAFWGLPPVWPSMTLRRSCAGVRSRRCARLRLAPGISAGRPSVPLFRRYVTASALARPLWRLRRYQSFPLLECVQCAGRINAWRSPDELDQWASAALIMSPVIG